MNQIETKFKRVLSMLCAAVLLCNCAAGLSVSADDVGTTLPCYNFDMESIGTDQSDNVWHTGNTDEVSLVNDTCITSGKSVKLARTLRENGADNFTQDTDIKMWLTGNSLPQPGDYTFTFAMKTEGVTTVDDGLKIRLINVTADGIQWEKNEGRKTKIVSEGEWSDVSADFTITAETTKVYVLITMQYGASGTAYVTYGRITPKGENVPTDEYKISDDGGNDDTGNTQVTVPYGDFKGFDSSKFSPNGTDKKLTDWYAEEGWAEVVNEGPEAGDYSMKLTGGDSYEAAPRIDLSASEDGTINTKLAPGKYVLSADVKLIDVDPLNGDSTNGFRLEALCWKKDDSFVNWDAFGYDFRGACRSGSTDGWEKMSLPFTVPEGVSTVTLRLVMRYATGTAYFTNVKVTVASDYVDFGNGSPVIEDGDFSDVKNLIANAGLNGLESDNIRYKWGWAVSEGDSGNGCFELVSPDIMNLPEDCYGACKILAKDAAVNYQLRQVVENLEQDMEYVLRCKVRTENLQSVDGGFSLRTVFLDAERNVTWEANGANVETKFLTGNNEWTEVALRFTMPKDTRDICVMTNVIGATGTVYVTDVELMLGLFYEGDQNKDDNSNTENNNNSDNDENSDIISNSNTDVTDKDNVDTGVAFFMPIFVLMIMSGIMLLVFKKRRFRFK